MLVTKDAMARDIAERSGYFLKDVKVVLSVMDDLLKEYFGRVTDEEDIVVQIVEGCKLSVKVVPERQRKNPKTQEDIVCKAQTKPQAKFSTVFRDLIQQQYEKKKAK